MQKIKELLQEISGTNVIVKDKILKTNTKKVDISNFGKLYHLCFLEEVETLDLKRSGTGITILVTLK